MCWNKWNKPPYIPIPVFNDIIQEYSSIRIATRLNQFLTRLQVTALTNNKRKLLT